MEITKFDIEGPLLIKPRVFHDERGYFYESFNESTFKNLGLDFKFVQDNQSNSSKNVLRGLHYQLPPYDQGKLVRVVKGSVRDIAVDIRRISPTFGQYISIDLTAESNTIFWIPPGFAHGFLSLEDDTLFMYKCTNLYHKESECGIIWNDPELNINWGIANPIVSDKDLELATFNNLDSRF